MAIAAQGFGARSRRSPGRDGIVAAVEHLGVVQLDSVNVVCRAHYLPLFARLGTYDRELLDDAAWTTPRSLFEYWGHEASFLPVSHQPLFRWRMARARAGEGIWSGVARFGRERRSYVDEVLSRVARDGPLRANDLESGPRTRGSWWVRSDAKRALEWLFWAGFVTTSSRKHFARIYDLPERVLPRAILDAPTPSEADAQRELLRMAARALGVATEDELADYFRISRRSARPRVLELVEEGTLERVDVEGAPAFLSPEAEKLRFSPRTAALLAPFDPLIWHRPRAHRLFDFHYRIGIYTPAHARTHGYYVLPFLLGDRLVARVDLKAERDAGVLAVKSAHLEPGADAVVVASALSIELARMAAWLGLERVEIARKGKLASTLNAAMKRAVAEHA